MIYNILSKILKTFSKPVVEKQKPKIVGITGSVGKTSTKEAVFSVLKEKYKKDVARSYKNLNTDIGLPLAILRIDKSPMGLEWMIVLFKAFLNYLKYSFFSSNYPNILILEYAADKPGDIEDLTNIVKPNVSVITEIGPAHLELFKNVDNVAKEKFKLAKNMRADGIAVLNEDNDIIKKYSKYIRYQIKWYHGSSIEGAKNAARVVGKIFKLNDKDISKGLGNLANIKGRLNVFDGIKDTKIIDDTYNASPLSMKMALKYLKDFKVGKRKVAILGDMRELGEASQKEHEIIANEIANSAKFAILIGPQMCKYTSQVLDEKKFDYLAFDNFTKAKKDILKNIKKEDVVLVKASQNKLFLERVTKMLLKDKKDASKLCRQTNKWKKIKEKTQ